MTASRARGRWNRLDTLRTLWPRSGASQSRMAQRRLSASTVDLHLRDGERAREPGRDEFRVGPPVEEKSRPLFLAHSEPSSQYVSLGSARNHAAPAARRALYASSEPGRSLTEVSLRCSQPLTDRTGPRLRRDRRERFVGRGGGRSFSTFHVRGRDNHAGVDHEQADPQQPRDNGRRIVSVARPH